MSHGGRHTYIHVPFCSGKCGYCSFYSEVYELRSADRYLDALEIELSSNLLQEPETIYVGGGTPSILSTSQLKRLCGMLLRRPPTVEAAFSPSEAREKSRNHAHAPVHEWTIEGNPGTFSAEKIRILGQSGVNRVSLGVQSFDDGILKSIGRRHASADVPNTVNALRASGIDNIGIDLIACLPGADDTTWAATLKRAVELEPRHISVYAMTIESGSHFHALLNSGQISHPSEEAQMTAMDLAEDVLGMAGFSRYEVSNFAQPGFECLHNLSCWRGEDYTGFGPAAASRAGLRRWTNLPDTEAYVRALAEGRQTPRDQETVSPDTDAVERLMFAFRLSEGVDLDTCAGAVPHLRPRWKKILEILETRGLVAENGGLWKSTVRGRTLADTIAAELLEA